MASKHDYPVYIISKGRAYNPMTALNFEKANIDYLIAVEPQEEQEYINVLGKNRILVHLFANIPQARWHVHAGIVHFQEQVQVLAR